MKVPKENPPVQPGDYKLYHRDQTWNVVLTAHSTNL